MTSIAPSLLAPALLPSLTRVLNRSSAFAIYTHSPAPFSSSSSSSSSYDSIILDYEAQPHEDCRSLWKHERLKGRGGKYVVVDVGWVWGREGKGKGGRERVEVGLGEGEGGEVGKGMGMGKGKGKGEEEEGKREGVVFLQWRREGGSMEREMAVERDYEPLRKAFGLERHARFCDWWMLDGWDSILRYTGFEREAYRVRYGGF